MMENDVIADNEQQDAEYHRYMCLMEAMQECVDKGVSRNAMTVLAYETGFNKKDLDKLWIK